MMIYQINKNSPTQFFWNNKVDYPNKETFNKIIWEKIDSHIDIGRNFEAATFVVKGAKPVMFFKVEFENQTYYYITQNWKYANGATICETTIDYWSTYFLTTETWDKFLASEFRFIRQPMYLHGVHDNVIDPLITSTKECTDIEMISFPHYKNSANIYNYWGLRYVLAGVAGGSKQTEEYMTYNFIYAVFFISETHPLRQKIQVMNKKGEQQVNAKLEKGYTLCVPILYEGSLNWIRKHPKGEDLFEEKGWDAILYNTPNGIAKLIRDENLINVFKGYYYGPPFFATPADAGIVVSQQDGVKGLYAAWIFDLYSQIEIPIPDKHAAYLKYLNPRISKSNIPASFFNEPDDIYLWVCTFTNRFILSSKRNDATIEYPLQLTSYTDSHLNFIAGNTNSLDTARTNAIATGTTNAFLGAFSAFTGVAMLNPSTFIGGVNQFTNSIASSASSVEMQKAMVKDNSIARSVENRAAVDEGNIWYCKTSWQALHSPDYMDEKPDPLPKKYLAGSYVISLSVPSSYDYAPIYADVLDNVKKEIDLVGWYGDVMIKPQTKGYHQLNDPFFFEKMNFNPTFTENFKNEIVNILKQGVRLK